MTPQQKMDHLRDCGICYTKTWMEIDRLSECGKSAAVDLLNNSLSNPGKLLLIGPLGSATWAYNRALKPL